MTTPKRFGAAPASALCSSALQVSRATITSAVFSWTCWNCSIPIASVRSETRPRTNSVFAVVRVTTWWVMWTAALVSV